jgi:hypothetical protein
MTELAKRFKKCKIWLDYDKLQEARQYALKSEMLFDHGCGVYLTKNDPKEIKELELERLLKSLPVKEPPLIHLC